MPYIGTTPTKVVSRQSANVYRYTATAGQSVFTGADLDNNVLACNPADMIVHMNGLRLESTDYTATSTSVTLTTAATAGDEVTVTSFVTFEVADTYTKSTADDRYVNTTGDTMTGNLAVGGVVFAETPTTSEPFVQIKAQNTSTVANTKYGGFLAQGLDQAHMRFVVGDNWGGPNAKQWQIRVGAGTGSDNLYVYSWTKGGDVFEIESGGQVKLPYQPSFSASPNGSGTDYSYGQPDQPQIFYYVWHNVGNHYSTTTGRFTAPVSGYYHLWCGGTSYCSGRNRYITAFWYRNGASFSAAGRGRTQTTGSGTEYVSPTMSNVVYLNANDYIQLYTYGEVGASAAYMHSLEFNWGARLIG